VQVLQGLADLLALLAHAEDEVALGDEPGGAGLGDDVERALVAEAGRMLLKMRGTVSTLCASTSGRASKTSCSSAGVPLKSGMSSSTPMPGRAAWIWRTVSAYSQAPPSGRSSRATPVTVAYFRPICATDSATRRGSSVS
jgi:hypothetical protein